MILDADMTVPPEDLPRFLKERRSIIVTTQQKFTEVLERRLGRVLHKLSEAEARIQKLQEQLAGSKKDSGNSSKPPSSDIVKPPKKPSLRRRRRGDLLCRRQLEYFRSCVSADGRLALAGANLPENELGRAPGLITAMPFARAAFPSRWS